MQGDAVLPKPVEKLSCGSPYRTALVRSCRVHEVVGPRVRIEYDVGAVVGLIEDREVAVWKEGLGAL
jgi:hypothetical protein